MVAAELLRPENRALIAVCDSPDAALGHLRATEPAYVEKWIGPDDR
jgi:hypothetical protein